MTQFRLILFIIDKEKKNYLPLGVYQILVVFGEQLLATPLLFVAA